MALKSHRITLIPALVALWSAGLGAQEGSAELEVAVAGHETVAVERVFDGTVEAVHQATVSAQTAGRIAEVGYDVDDFVEAYSRHNPDNFRMNLAAGGTTIVMVTHSSTYAGYGDRVIHLLDGRVVPAACWAHVRRKFYEIAQAHASPLADEALKRIGQLYAIEAEIRGQPPDVRQGARAVGGRARTGQDPHGQYHCQGPWARL